MKKTILFSAFLLNLLNSINAVDLEVRGAYFNPQDNHIRSVYGHRGMGEYEIEGSGPVINENWALWGNLSYYGKHGRSSCLKDRTHMHNTALNFGLKYYVYANDPIKIYFGLGMGMDFLRIHNHSHFVHNVNKWGLATLAKSGIECRLTELLFLDFFVDYSYNWVPTRSSRHCVSSWNLNTGGLKAGIGLGFHF